MTTDQAYIDQRNASFWDELCGSSLARDIGATDRTPESLAAFDAAYMALYPYLPGHAGLGDAAGKAILEVGLGYGTVSQMLAKAGTDYTGLDIAAGPVAMVEHRLRLAGLRGRAVQGNALAMPFPDASFDRVVSIGCYHHTGDVDRCLAETYRVLRPGGEARIMVYNALSAMQWKKWPLRTLHTAIRDLWGGGPLSASASTAQRATYDVDSSGQGAPETVFLTVRGLRRLLRQFRDVAIVKENAAAIAVGGRVLLSRERGMVIAPLLGLDLYVKARR